MMKIRWIPQRVKRTTLTIAALRVVVCSALLAVSTIVVHGTSFVEGNCNGSRQESQTTTTPGTCGDYDGDGRLGTAEDADGDRVFGTITAALNQDNRITIVTSGIFAESLTITAEFGNVTLQAAPGIEAFITPPSRGGVFVGITINVTNNDPPYVVLRNLHLSDWESGILVQGNSCVAVEDCRVENNLFYGISASGNTKLTITGTKVHVTATNLNADEGPDPTYGIVYSGRASGTIFSTTVSGTFIGISNRSTISNAVCAYNVNVFDNVQNFENITPSSVPCGSAAKGRTFFGR